MGVRVWIVAAAVLAAAQVSPPAEPRAARGGQPVTEVARSIVLRSTHILLANIVSATPGPWAPSSPPGLNARHVDLTLRLEEIVRGALDIAPGATLHITVTQHGYAGLLMMQPLPGVWSGVELTPGTSLAIFSVANGTAVALALAEPNIIQIAPAAALMPGLRVARRTLDSNLPLAAALAQADAHIGELDPAFAEFIWSKYGAEAIASQSDFDRIVAFAEKKGLQVRTRNGFLLGAYDLVGMHGDDKPERARRLALAMFRVLLMPDTAELHENLIDTYLPNLLGVASDMPHQRAAAVFNGHAAERAAVRAFLQKHGTDADATELLNWLDAS